MRMYDRVTLALAAGTAVAAMLLASPNAHAAPVQEDDPGWNCVTMGNRICGPSNTNGVVAGCYSDTGTLVAEWPCRVEVNPDGSSDVYADPVTAVEYLLGRPTVPASTARTWEDLMLEGLN